MLKRILCAAAVCALLALTMSGCVIRPVDELYALPALPAEYSDLQVSIDATIRELGAEYATINSGSNTSTIQMLDLDGNGEQETAAVFLRVPASAEGKSLRVCLFRRGSDDTYRRSCMIEGDGTSVNSVAYEDLTGDGSREIVVSWQMGAGVFLLAAYQITVNGSVELMSTGYNEGYLTTDLDRDGDAELMVFQRDASGENGGRAEYYDYREGAMTMTSSAPLSLGMRDLTAARSGALGDGGLGVYATLEVEGGALTDVLALDESGLVNLTRDSETGVSRSTFRSYTDVAETDINSDGVLEIPMPVQLAAADPESVSTQYLIYWRQFDRSGQAKVSCVTYHSVANGWYLNLPDSWAGNITAARDDSSSARGERAVVFYYWADPAGTEPAPFLTVYRLTGANRNARAKLSGRFILASDSSTVYCAVLDPDVWDCGVDQTALIQRFRIITADWSSQ